MQLTHREKFYNEANIMQRVCATPHENVVRLFGICASAEPYCLTMELCA